MLLPTEYFDLALFSHRALFDLEQPAWKALSQIKLYLQSAKLGAHEGTIEPGATLVHPELVTVGRGSVIESGAYIKGPCIIGNDCEVRHGAYIRGQLITGDRCVVGHATEVKNAIFLNDVHAAHFNYVGDSILGNKVNLGAGTILANLRFDKKNIIVIHNGQEVDSGLRKFGAILGDEAQTGCNSVTNPGTIMGKKSLCAPCQTPKGVVSAEGFVK